MINRDSERIPLSVAQRQTLKKVYDYYGASGVIDKVDKYLFDKDLLLIGEDGANLINRSTPIAFIAKGKYWVNNHAHVLDVCGGLNLAYIALFINAISLVNYVTGTAQPKMNQEKMNSILVTVPPISEQARIVNQIESLQPLIIRYDKAQSELNILNTSVKEQLKKSILQEAIQGHLVPQIVEEGTAEELLAEIRKEKKRLVNEGKLKKSALNDSIIFKGDDNKYYEQIGSKVVDITGDIPFEIPPTWMWCRFGTIVKMRIGKTPPRGEQVYWSNGKHNWVSISDMVEGGTIKAVKEKVSDIAVNEIFKCYPTPKGSLLMSFKLTVGRTSILGVDAYHNEAIITIVPYADVNNIFRDYLFYILPTISNSGDSKDAIKGKTLNNKSLNNLLIPLPPLLEQKRIVTKIELVNSKIKG
ncbi:restriction endonuclease subunit S [uncultured Alistipes sp.]|jgi:type I restriction enzyme S subunit|uniref:restriction endonuclease subunit S n=1 Tax=uncultured Alistipes sp. TaxID=538949 RepID=UPI0026206117|nr:restriction endonuclease subunit S [uncultured Alistipes sp.]